MAVKAGPAAATSSHACAACKYQRRKCTPDCPLAPFFPADQPKLFQNAHRLFGVSNILKILNKIQPAERTDAMKSILYEANVRELYPVHGCYGVSVALEFQIQQLQTELDEVNATIRLCRDQLAVTADNNNGSSYNVVVAGSNNDNSNVCQQLWVDQNSSTNVVPGTTMYNDSYTDQEEFSVRKMEQEFDEICIYDAIDDCLDEGSSSDSPPPPTDMLHMSKTATEHVSVNELKNAAACFTLTSVLN